MYQQSDPGVLNIDYNPSFLYLLRDQYQAENSQGVIWPYKYIEFLDYINQFNETHVYLSEFYKIIGRYTNNEALELFLSSVKDYQRSITAILEFIKDLTLKDIINRRLKNPWCIGKDNKSYYFIELKTSYEPNEDIIVYKYKYGLNQQTVYMHDISALSKKLICNEILKNT